MLHQPVSRIVDRLDPAMNRLTNMDLAEARRRVRAGRPDDIRAIGGSFAIVESEGVTVRMVRSLDRPLRYFLAKRQEGPALYVADRIDTLHQSLAADGLASQFHPSYTRMVPAHYVVEIALVGCPDPSPAYTRFFTPARATMPAEPTSIGQRYVQALSREVGAWLRQVEAEAPGAPIGVAFSGGIDSGAVFLVVYHALGELGLSPARLKAFVLNLGDGEDVRQARRFLDAVGLQMFLEEIDAAPEDLDLDEAIRVLEDYKALDVECAAMGLALCRRVRARYPEWRYLVDGDGGDENLKDYPIEDNEELTIRSVIDNPLLYHEGWGVGRLKHSLTYSGGLSRSYTRTYAPARRYGFDGFSPYTRPSVVEVAEAIPFAAMTAYDVPALYALKGEIVREGVRAVTGVDMPVFPKRRFQHGAASVELVRQRLPGDEQTYRRMFHGLYA